MFRKKVDEKTKLVLLTMSDAERLFNLVDENREYLNAWMTWTPKTNTPKDTGKFIKESLVALASNEQMACGIEFNGELAGVITYNKISNDLKKVVVGYWIAENLRGKGIITKCCRSLIDYAFDSMSMEKVEIHVASENRPSQRVCEKLGFSVEGTIKNAENLHGEIVHHNIYGLIKSNGG